VLVRLGELFTKGRRERDLAAELDAHLEHHIEENLRSGMAPGEARRQAMLRLGGIEQTKDAYRDRRGFPWIDASLQDLQYAGRVLRKNPGFTAVAIATLALGVGANSAMFSIVNAVLLRPLPFPQASRLVQIFAADSASGRRTDVVSYPDYEDWRAAAAAFDSMSAFVTRSLLVSNGQTADLVLGARVAPSIFDTLGVQPAIGRTFRQDETEPGASHVVLLGDGFWKRQFGGDPGIVGSTLRLNDEPHTIIGVMPAGFRIYARSPEQLYVPLVVDANRGHGFLSVVGRLRDGTSVSQAQSELGLVARRLAADYPKTNATTGVNVMPLVDAMAGPSRSGLLMLLAVVGLVLLIACTNVANLLLARGAARLRELRVRAALGAGRGRLVRQLLTESLLLAGLGGALGLVLAQWTGRLLVAILAATFRIPRIENTGVDGSVFAFTLVVALVTGVLFGVAPALSASSPELTDGLQGATRASTGTARARRLRSSLVVAEFAMALILLGGAGALLKTLVTMRSTQPGFQSDGLVVVDIWLPQPKYATLPPRRQFFDTVLDRLRATPGVVVVNEAAAERFWPGERAIGKQILLPGEATDELEEHSSDRGPAPPRTIVTTLTIVGVAANVHQASLAIAPAPEFYLNTEQANLPWPWLVLAVKTANADPLALSRTIESISRSADAFVPVQKVRTMDDVLSASMAEPRVYTLLLGGFAALAVVLAAIGLYGVISYGVAQRTREIGIRVALGAARTSILRLVLRQGLVLAAIGAAIGLGGAIAILRALAGVVRGVVPGDATTLALVTLALMAVALAACYVPARRAARVDPMTALRDN